jgi:predicted phosphate transport protein (TIGR00153 family)
LRFNLLPRERTFYTMFERNSDITVAAAETLCSLLQQPQAPEEKQRIISELEHEADDITHEIVKSINRTFVTPFDREDIYALASGMDDVVDYIKEISDKFGLYDLREASAPAIELGGLVLEAAQQLRQAMGKLESQKGLEPHWIEIHRLENQGDQVSRQAISDLFRGAQDPIHVMKLKDIYEVLEDALDRSEDVANVLENIVIKNA